MLFLDNDDIRAVLTPEITIDALRQSYAEVRNGESVLRPRIDVNIPIGQRDAYFKWGTMEGGSAASGYFATRIKIDIFYRSEYEADGQTVVTAEKYSTRPGKYCGLILLVKTENAEPVAIINDSALQRLRVGADGAIGTDYLARPDAEVMGILGSGGMAHTQLAATLALRKNIRKIQIYSPTRAHREEFAAEIRRKYEIEAVALETGEAAFRGADILASCTDGGFKGEENNAIVIGRWLEPGTHWTNISGGAGPDTEAVSRTDVALRLGSAPAPVGYPELASGSEAIQYAVPATNPLYAEDEYYVENFTPHEGSSRRPSFNGALSLAELLSGAKPGRTSADQITYSTRGNLQGAQFHAVASRAYEIARERGIGREVPTEWFLQDERD